MVGLLIGVVLKGTGHLWITLAVGLTGHGQIHTYFAALASKSILAVLYQVVTNLVSIGAAKLMDGSELRFVFERNVFKLAAWSLAQRTELRSLGAFVDVPTYGTDKFLFHNVCCVCKLFICKQQIQPSD